MPIDDLSAVQWDDEPGPESPGLTIDITGGVRESELAQAQAQPSANIDLSQVQWDDAPAQVGLTGVTREQRQAQIAQADAALDLDRRNAVLGQQTDAGRAMALGGRAILGGLAAIPDIVVAPVTGLIERVTRPDATMSDLITGNQPQGIQLGTIRQSIDALADMAGAPRPENAMERVSGDMTGAVAGALTGVGLGNTLRAIGSYGAPVVGNALTAIGENLATQPGQQALAALSGSGAAGITRESGGSEGAQALAALAGGLTPSVSSAAGSAAVRGAIRGRSGAETANRLADFAQLGATPSAGQATQNRMVQGLESLLAGAPTSSGVLTRFAERQAEQIGEGLQNTATGLARNPSAENAGRAIERGVSRFKNNTKVTQQVLYSLLDRYLPAQTPVPLSNTWRTVVALTTPNQAAQATTGALIQPRIAALRNNLQADLAANGGNLPYDALKKVRSDIGEIIGNDSALVPSADIRELRRIYGAMSQDMESAARNQGPQAAAAANLASRYTRMANGRLESIEHVLDKNGGPEAVFNAVMSGTKDGATTLRNVMNTLPADEQREVAGAVIKRMGLANAGNQDAAGEIFSASTFLTNWNKLSPEARSVLFDRFGPGFSQSMKRLANVADNIKTGSKIYANPSQSAHTGAAYAFWGSLPAAMFGGMASGNYAPLAGIVGGGTVANLTARLLTNPKAVNWLATATSLPRGALIQSAEQLSRTADRDGDEDLAQLAELVKQDAQNQNGAPQQSGNR